MQSISSNNVNVAVLMRRSYPEAAREQAHTLTVEKPIAMGLSNHHQCRFMSPLW
jgi:hypothetical protein